MIALVLVLLGQAPVEIRASVDGRPARSGWAFVRAGQAVVVEAEVAEARWFEVAPVTRSVDNTSPSFHFEPIAYERRELLACSGRRRCSIETGTLGARAFQVEGLGEDGSRRASPGVEASELGGLGRSVFRVVVRRDDSYLGFLTELLGTPYIFGSSGQPPLFQPDLLIGSDCADLVVYGARREGRDVGYTSSWGMQRLAAKVAVVASPGAPGAVREGDVLHFPRTRHVGVLYQDVEPRGVLDERDLLIHTCWAPATIQPLGATGCASYPVNVLRWPTATPPAAALRPAQGKAAPRR